MVPTIHLIRHAQGYHNIGHEYHSLRDPALTPLGIEQCQTLASTFPPQSMSKIMTIIASPLQRTILTAHHSLVPAIEARKLTIVALPLLQETGQAPCDTGVDTLDIGKKLSTSCPDAKIRVDLSLLEEEENRDWTHKSVLGRWGNSSYAISVRARQARQFLLDVLRDMMRNGEEGDIAVVSHGGFLHYLTEDWEDAEGPEGVSWRNTEWRSYTFREFIGGSGSVTPVSGNSSGSSTPGAAPNQTIMGRESLDVGRLEDWPKPRIGSKYEEFVGLVPFTNDVDNATLVETEESRARRGKTGTIIAGREEQERLAREVVERWERKHEANGWKQF